jgi:hypothetical protein
MAVIVSSVPRSRVDIMLNGMCRIVIINQFFFRLIPSTYFQLICAMQFTTLTCGVLT